MVLQILLYCVVCYFVTVSLNYFAFRWELRVREVNKTDFEATVTEMWVPIFNIFTLFSTISMIHDVLKEKREEKRKRENSPSFHERLFRVRSNENGTYHIKKITKKEKN